MSTQLPPKYHGALIAEIQEWQTKKIITSEIADQLITLYEVSDSPVLSSKAILWLSIGGAVLLGAGFLLAITANWQHMSAVLKLMTLAISFALANYGGYHFRFEPGKRPKLGEAFFILASMIYGASIWLVAQVFNIDTNYPAGMLLWAVGTTALAVLLKSGAQGCFSAILLGVWAIWQQTTSPPARIFAEGNPLNFVHHEIYFIAAFSASLIIAKMARSRATALMALIAGSIWAPATLMNPIGSLIYGAGLFGAYLIFEEKWQLLAGPAKWVSLLCIFSSLLGDTWNFCTKITLENKSTFAGLMFLAILILGYAVVVSKKFREEAAVTLVILLLAVLATTAGDTLKLVAFNLLLIGAIGGAIYHGAFRAKSTAVINFALVFFVLEVLSRYCDMFFNSTHRALFFMLGGVVLMTAGAIAERSRRKLLERF